MAYKGPNKIVGPGSSTDDAIVRFSGTTGTFTLDSGVTISDADVVSGATQVNVDNIRLDGNTISSTDTDGNITLAPDGTGVVSVTAAAIVPSGDRAESLGSATNSWNTSFADGVTFDDGTNVIANFVDVTAFTPGIEFGGASVGITYSTQSGYYSRIGNSVMFQIHIVLSNKGSSTGIAKVVNFPIQSFGSNQQYCTFVPNDVSNTSGETQFGATFTPNSTAVFLQNFGSTGLGNLTNAEFTNTSELRLWGCYQV